MDPKTPIVLRRQVAIFDVIGIAEYLAERVSLSVADRFISAVDKTTRRLARVPGMGSHWDRNQSRLADVRFFPVERFRNHILFYRPIDGGIELLRVLHGASDLERELDEPDEEVI